MMRNAQEAPMSSNFRPAGEPSFTEDPLQNISNRASDAIDYLKNAPEKTYDYLKEKSLKEMGVFTKELNSDNIFDWVYNYDKVEYNWCDPIDDLIKKIEEYAKS
jgi:hypothetical protein